MQTATYLLVADGKEYFYKLKSSLPCKKTVQISQLHCEQKRHCSSEPNTVNMLISPVRLEKA